MHWQRGMIERWLLIGSDSYSAFVCQVQSSVVANILSSLCALVGFILLSVTLDAVDPAFRKCTFNEEQRKPERTTFSYFINPYMDKQCITAKTTLTVSIFRWVVPVI